MLRRNTRLRKEYLYRKSLEGKERVSYENKRKIRKALAEGKPIPRELLDVEESLRREIELEDESRKVPKFDDEYENAGVSDPKIFITTSRDPSSRLVIFAKELSIILPNCQKMNRGSHQISELIEACRVNQVTDFIIVTETHGDPNGMIISHLPYGPTAYFSLSSVVMRHDVQVSASLPKVYPHLLFHNFTTTMGERVQTILKHLFPVPLREDSKRVITFANDNDYISFRHHIYEKTGHKDIKLTELGPRFEMRLYEIRLGTIEMDEADKEFTLHPFMNTAKKRTAL